METERTLSRPTLTVQDMTVDSAKPPILPSVATPRCDLRPSPGTAVLQPTKRRERCACTGAIARLTALQLLVRTSILQQTGNVKRNSMGRGFSACGGGLFIPCLERLGLSSPISVRREKRCASPRNQEFLNSTIPEWGDRVIDAPTALPYKS